MKIVHQQPLHTHKKGAYVMQPDAIGELSLSNTILQYYVAAKLACQQTNLTRDGQVACKQNVVILFMVANFCRKGEF
jgi:hypothetical protein